MRCIDVVNRRDDVMRDFAVRIVLIGGPLVLVLIQVRQMVLQLRMDLLRIDVVGDVEAPMIGLQTSISPVR